MAILPEYVKVIAEGWEQERDTAVIRTPMEDGMIKQLRTKSRVLVTRNVVLRLDTLVDYQNFITWYEDEVNFGADWFDWTDPLDNQTKLARFKDKLGIERPLAGTTQWRISAMLETWST